MKNKQCLCGNVCVSVQGWSARLQWIRAVV